jgi:hypothetical protein
MMADLFPNDPKRIRERIRRYERALKREPGAVMMCVSAEVSGLAREREPALSV